MATKIQWTESTWNPIRGCSRISPGCKRCYAERMAARALPGMNSPTTGDPFAIMTPAGPRWTGKVELIEKTLSVPLKRKKPTTWFVDSMSDLFHEDLPDADILAVFQVMGKCPRHTFQILTKRADRMQAFLLQRRWRNFGHSPAMGGNHYVAIIPGLHRDDDEYFLPNVHLGVSVENADYGHRIDSLRGTPAALRFVSYEPALGPPDFDIRGIDWLIMGGESGPGARPCDVEWFRRGIWLCRQLGVAPFVKQMGANVLGNLADFPTVTWAQPGNSFGLDDPKGGSPEEWPLDLRVREMPEVTR